MDCKGNTRDFLDKRVMYDNKYMTFAIIMMGVIKGKEDVYDRTKA